MDGVVVTFTRLTIQNSKALTTLGEKVFSGDAFEQLTYLTLSSTGVNSLRKSVFEGTILTNVEINYGEFKEITIEENAFGAIYQTLQQVQLQNCLTSRSNALPNVTGSNAKQPLSAVVQLDLRQNNLDILKASSFTNVPILKRLFLSGSGLVQIEPSTFSFFSLEILDISYNQLTTLPEGLFDKVQGGISLDKNRWRCDCDLVWLQQLFLSKPSLLNGAFICDDPPGSYILFPFCPNDTSTSSPTSPKTSSISTGLTTDHMETTTSSTPSTTTPSTTTAIATTTTTTTTSTTTMPTTTTTTPVVPTTPKYPEKVPIRCEDYSTNDTLPNGTSAYVVHVRNSSITMEFSLQENEPDGVKYLLRFKGDVSNEVQLWYDSSRTLIGCASNLSENGPIAINLAHHTTYVFCLLRGTEDTVSPYDCTGLRVPPPLGDQTWLANNTKIPLICALCGSLLAAIIISGLIVFYCIRQHPSWIKGNKRVIIVESEAADAIVMPRTYYDEVAYRPPSLNSYSNGYLTPKYHGIYDQRVRRGLKTVSENIAFVPTTSGRGRMRRSHYRRRTRLEHVTQAFDDHLYEAPPLPPNHPSGRWANDAMSLSYSRV